MATYETTTSSLATLIQKCTSTTTNSLRKVRQLHALIITTKPLNPTPFLNNKLLSMYAKSGSLQYAQRVFDKMPLRNLVSYNALISAYSRAPQQALSSLQLFPDMTNQGFKPNSTTFSSLLQASLSLENQSTGSAIHSQVIRSGFSSDLCVQTSLLGMYSNCGNLEYANRAFGDLNERDDVAWNSIIFANMKNDRIEQGMQLFCNMIRAGSVPTPFTFSIVLNSCSKMRDRTTGRIIHAQIIKSDSPADVALQNALLDMYSSCGDAETAFFVFREIETPDLVSWNSMITGYSENGDGEMAMDLFIQLRNWSSEKPDEYTFAAIVSATGDSLASYCGKPLHALVTKTGFECSVFVGSTLISMYFKNGDTDKAQKLFDSMSGKDVILWTEMITGYSRLGEGEKAVKYFCRMLEEGYKVDSFALSSLLSSSADLATLKQGEMIHSQVVKTGYEGDTCVSGSLVDMYAKNGDLPAARIVFSGVRIPDLKCWNSMIGGYGHDGYAEMAFELFSEMIQRGLRPDRVTFISLLSACSHCGLIERGRFYWNNMVLNSLIPGPKHYSCMVSLLSRAGLLQEAKELIHESPFGKDFPELWRILLSSSVVHRNLEMGIRAAEQVFRLEPEDSAAHILLSNLYADSGRWEAVAKMRRKIRGLVTEKDPGLSWIEIRNEIHTFSADDESHPRVDEARVELHRLQGNIKGWETPEINI